MGESYSQYAELRAVQVAIDKWYQKQSAKILFQSRCQEVSSSETVRIFHHDLHKKHLKRTSILKLQADEVLLEGHSECAAYLEDQVAQLLLHPHVPDQAARDCLLNEVDLVYTEEDNRRLLSTPPTRLR